jgi:tetratricopeptide (TPR) repeat protein
MSLGSLPEESIQRLSLAETLFKLSQYLQDYEYRFIQFPDFFPAFSRLISDFFARCYRRDVFQFKQLLLHTAIEEHLQQIRSTPTDLEVHASLAASYVALSKMYSEHSHLYRKDSAAFEEKFKIAASLAIEEFQILSHYAPNDPWVHEQLAAGYRDLQMHKEEILEVELLLKLKPQDKDILFRLGSLYFRQGQNAKGLQVYEELKTANFKKAEDLISSYGCMAGCLSGTVYTCSTSKPPKKIELKFSEIE